MHLHQKITILLCACTMAAAAPGCSTDDDAIRADVQLVAMMPPEGSATQAAERLAKHGRRALPPVEAALHTADVTGRKNLVLVLRKIGDPDAVSLLRHLALFDAAPDVRREAEWTLKTWAAGKDARGERSRAALREIDERREREEAG
jgi:HEAT repeats